jgi:hypothetical protein
MHNRDHSRPTTKQGLFRKYEVKRIDGRSDGAEPVYLVLKLRGLTADNPDAAALKAYIEAVRASHPILAQDLERWLPPGQST